MTQTYTHTCPDMSDEWEKDSKFENFGATNNRDANALEKSKASIMAQFAIAETKFPFPHGLDQKEFRMSQFCATNGLQFYH